MRKRWTAVWQETRRYFWTGLVFLTVCAAVGYVWPDGVTALVQGSLSQIKEMAENIRETGSPAVMFWTIFLNNFTVSLLLMVLGVLFAVFPAFSLLINGVLLGYVLALVGRAGIDPWMMFLTGILPHGLLELPAVVFAAAMGIRLGVLATRSLRHLGHSDRRVELWEQWKRTVKQVPTAAAAVFFLLLTAALVESFVTPYLIRNILGLSGSAL